MKGAGLSRLESSKTLMESLCLHTSLVNTLKGDEAGVTCVLVGM